MSEVIHVDFVAKRIRGWDVKLNPSDCRIGPVYEVGLPLDEHDEMNFAAPVVRLMDDPA